jgi:hypothetical protein
MQELENIKEALIKGNQAELSRPGREYAVEQRCLADCDIH